MVMRIDGVWEYNVTQMNMNIKEEVDSELAP
jgi:hypothetical protein